MSLQSLESERDAILRRMQMSRDSYRHTLLGEEHAAHSRNVADVLDVSPVASVHHPAYVQTRHDGFPRSMTMKLLTRHPVAIAAVAAALVIIGPRRLTRAAVTGSTALATLTLRNKANAAMVSRLIAMAGQYMQQRNQPRRWSR
jgi:hypothetical protein